MSNEPNEDDDDDDDDNDDGDPYTDDTIHSQTIEMQIKMVRKKKTIEIEINDAVVVTIDVNEFRNQLNEKIEATEKSELTQFSLTECAEICGVDAPQLGYYVMQGIVKPIGKFERGFKKYFSLDALLAFYIVKSLKESMRINIDCLKTLQKALR